MVYQPYGGARDEAHWRLCEAAWEEYLLAFDSYLFARSPSEIRHARRKMDREYYRAMQLMGIIRDP